MITLFPKKQEVFPKERKKLEAVTHYCNQVWLSAHALCQTVQFNA